MIKFNRKLSIFPLALLFSLAVHAQNENHQSHVQHRGPKQSEQTRHSMMLTKVSYMPSDCSENEIWEPATAMCLVRPSGEEVMHIMVHGNAFLVGISQSGSRGEDKIALPNMLMADIGRTLGSRHFLNLNLMLTAEKWTFPRSGYPLLLQTGEANKDGHPYVDAQHPHSSPIMGLTLSDTISFGSGKDHFKVFFAPRGQSTDGPIAFMHRPTGVANPDAPLGHHIAQDVGHITSTVVGGSVRVGSISLELSGFNGTEPEPDKVDLPLGEINSIGTRLTQYFSDDFVGMVSWAYVKEPHPHGHGSSPLGIEPFDEHVTSLQRYSASLYTKGQFGSWEFYNTGVIGFLETKGVSTSRLSFGHEFLAQKAQSSIWGRTEILERLPAELLISSSLDEEWVGALTLGYSHRLKKIDNAELKAGISGTVFHVSEEFDSAYGKNPMAGKVFLQMSGMKMWEH